MFGFNLLTQHSQKLNKICLNNHYEFPRKIYKLIFKFWQKIKHKKIGNKEKNEIH